MFFPQKPTESGTSGVIVIADTVGRSSRTSFQSLEAINK
ncbi:hypothetical protein Barb4_04676 [Bacteroidales bacterium Barb4]|nr:hypothetical protein Barb4_04676 [Bacteroidales bacterium Barb4]